MGKTENRIYMKSIHSGEKNKKETTHTQLPLLLLLSYQDAQLLAQCKGIYVLYSSGNILVCSWTLGSPSVQVGKLSQQFVFQSILKVEPGCSFPYTPAISVFLLCLCVACAASQ